MTPAPDRRLLLLGFGALAATTGCASLLTEPPRKLYKVTANSDFPDLPQLKAQLLVDLPAASQGLDTNRIALSRSAVTLDYFADAEWTDRAPRLVQSALVESFENSKAVTAIERETIGLRADFVLKSDLRRFEAVYAPPQGAPQVWVAVNVRLVKMPERVIVAQTSVERSAAATGNDVPTVVVAFSEALAATNREIVLWAVRNPALSARR